MDDNCNGAVDEGCACTIPPGADIDARADAVSAGYVFRYQLNHIGASATYTFRTHVSEGDAVMHLLNGGRALLAGGGGEDPSQPFLVHEREQANDNNGMEEVISVTAPALPPLAVQSYTIVVRAKDPIVHPTTMVNVTKQVDAGPEVDISNGFVSVGGTQVPVHIYNLVGTSDPTSKDVVTTVLRFGGSPDPFLYALKEAVGGGPFGVVAMDDNLGVDLSPRIAGLAPGDYVFLVGTGDPNIPSSGPGSLVDLVRNDSCDNDRDGLGHIIESRMQMCDNQSQTFGSFSCAAICPPNPACDPLPPSAKEECEDLRREACLVDTDDDGLLDNEELLGRMETSTGISQLLPAWGASPRHRDVFVESDLADFTNPGTPSRGAVGPNIGAQLAASDFPRLAARYDRLTMVNPDGTRGTHIHVDMGGVCRGFAVISFEAADQPGEEGAASCGNLCGGTETGIRVCPGGTHVDDVTTHEEALTNFMTFGSYRGPGRQGLFHWSLSNCALLAAQAPVGGVYLDTFCTPPITDPFEGGTARFADWKAMAHELGHNLSLQHWGTGPEWSCPESSIMSANCNPVYPSLMNYALRGSSRYEFSAGKLAGVAFSQGSVREDVPLTESATVDVSSFSDVGDGLTPASCPTAPFTGVAKCFDFNRDGRITEGVAVRADLQPLALRECEGGTGHKWDLTLLGRPTDALPGTAPAGGPALVEFEGLRAYVIAELTSTPGAGVLHERIVLPSLSPGWTALSPSPEFRADGAPVAARYNTPLGGDQLWLFATRKVGAPIAPIHFNRRAAGGAFVGWDVIPGQDPFAGPGGDLADVRDVAAIHFGTRLIVFARSISAAGSDSSRILTNSFEASGPVAGAWSGWEPLAYQRDEGGMMETVEFQSTTSPGLAVAQGALYMTAGSNRNVRRAITIRTAAVGAPWIQFEPLTAFPRQIADNSRAAIVFSRHLRFDLVPVPEGTGFITLWRSVPPVPITEQITGPSSKVRFVTTRGTLTDTESNIFWAGTEREVLATTAISSAGCRQLGPRTDAASPGLGTVSAEGATSPVVAVTVMSADPGAPPGTPTHPQVAFIPHGDNISPLGAAMEDFDDGKLIVDQFGLCCSLGTCQGLGVCATAKVIVDPVVEPMRAYCGDGVCDGPENCADCPLDCGPCP